MRSVFKAASDCLAASDPDEKIAKTREVAAAWARGDLTLDADSCGTRNERPGLPARLVLVSPFEVPRRRLGGRRGAAPFIHAIAHIEFNAIHLAWDCVQRFRGLPRGYYSDWVAIAADEAEHFSLLRARLHDLDCEYGDFPAHHGLWEMAEKTAGDLLERMALVPRYLEARGLDVAPSMIERLERSGDSATAAVVRVILREEVAHVAAGSRWFRYLCEERGLDSEREFIRLVRTHLAGRIKGPLNEGDRSRAGFTAAELEELRGMSSSR
jgi:uncharacterized ferritin-like protein (DUF455 family)